MLIKKRRTGLCFFILLLAALLFLAGCGESVNFLSGPEEAPVNTVISNKIGMPIERIRTLNPVLSKDEDAYYIHKLVYDGLFDLDEGLAAIPVLASSYAFSEDGTSVTIHLNSGIRWHDGESFSANDVKFSIDAYLANSGTSYYDTYTSGIRSAKVEDEQTVVIQFVSGTNAAAEMLTFPIIPRHQFANVSAVRSESNRSGFVPIGTGKYKVEEMDPDSEIFLVGYDGYHGERASNTVSFKVMPDRQEAVNIFNINDMNVTYSKDMGREAVFSNNNVNLIAFPANEVELIGFNCNAAALQDKRVRKAVAYTVNRKEIMEVAYQNTGISSDTIYYPGYMGTDSEEMLLEQDLEKAIQLLADAGYVDRDGNGFVENAEGEEITINILVNSENSNRINAAQIVKKELDKLPIHSYIIIKDWDGYRTSLNSGDYDLYIGGYTIQDNFDLRFLLHGGYNNPVGYQNQKMDELLDYMKSGRTREESQATFREIKTILADEMPYYCLMYKTYALVTSENLRGNIESTFQNVYKGIESWKLEEVVKSKDNNE